MGDIILTNKKACFRLDCLANMIVECFLAHRYGLLFLKMASKLTTTIAIITTAMTRISVL